MGPWGWLYSCWQVRNEGKRESHAMGAQREEKTQPLYPSSPI
jgi:hypothetical protein